VHTPKVKYFTILFNYIKKRKGEDSEHAELPTPFKFLVSIFKPI
jgi:hypothetical protein